MSAELDHLIAEAREGNKRAVSKLITRVEQGGPAGRDTLHALWEYTGNAKILGITGPPGAGKSTLTNQLVKCYRAQGMRVGVIAVDPTSPFTGGAILGDRVRMGDVTLDPHVFIRSMGTRGQLGGLSAACAGAVNVLDACGFDRIILETVGVGQSEVAVVHIADLVVVLSVPGLGDDVQSFKAGILEIGDIFVVNKADLPMADRVATELRAMLNTAPDPAAHDIPVLMVSAADGDVDELYEEAERQYLLMESNGALDQRRARRCEQELHAILHDEIDRFITEKVLSADSFQQGYADFLAHRSNPYGWVDQILSGIIGK